MSTAQRQRFVSEDEYLESERKSVIQHEYVDGVLFAMGGASREHGIIATNIIAAIRPHLRGSKCRVTASDMKVRLAEGRRYYYPDLVVSCSDRRDEPDRYTETRPVLLVEILSASTAATDRREKLLAYQALPGLVDYLVVSQDTEAAELYSCDAEGWSHTVFSAGESVKLESIGLTIAISDLFEDVFPID